MKKGRTEKIKQAVSILLLTAMLFSYLPAKGIEAKEMDSNTNIDTWSTETQPNENIATEKEENNGEPLEKTELQTEENLETVQDHGTKLEYVYIDKSIVNTPDTQKIATVFSESTHVDSAIISCINTRSGVVDEVSAEITQDNMALFNINYEDETKSGVYNVQDVIIVVDGQEYNFNMNELEIDSTYGVNEECTTNPDTVLEKEGVGIDEIDMSVTVMGEDGSVNETGSINEAMSIAMDQKQENGNVSRTRSAKANGSVVVVLDPGHDNNHAGAQANGYAEEQITLKIAQYCRDELNTYYGVQVYMTRTGGECPSARGNVAGHREWDEAVCLKNRAAYAGSKNADVFISFHLNSFTSPTAKGAEVYFASGSNAAVQGQSLEMAKKVAAQLGALGLSLRNGGQGTNTANFSVLRNNIAQGTPAILIEHCFVSNPDEANNYLSSDYKLQKLGQADALGIAQYLNLSKGQWIQNDHGWWFQYANGSWPSNCWALLGGDWYYFDQAGYRQTGFITVGGNKYFLSDEGKMLSNAWHLMEDKWYYFGETGAMLRQSWLSLGGTWYYLEQDGSMTTGWRNFDEYRYYFDSSGAMYTGKHAIDGIEYDFGVSGWIKTGWQLQVGKWYYVQEDLTFAKGLCDIGGQKYYFNNDGSMITGWKLIKNKWYYFSESGAMLRQNWLLLGNTWYYLEQDGSMTTGWRTFDEYRYYFDSSGAMYTGEHTIDGKKYNFGASGWIKTGWELRAGSWYYVKEDFSLAKGLCEIVGQKYYFNNDGSMITGWKLINNKWYYFSGSGAMLRQYWLLLGSTWYYLEQDGSMTTGWRTFDEYRYYFDSSGAMCTGKHTIDGQKYDFGASGWIKTGWELRAGSWYYVKEDFSLAKGLCDIGSSKFYFNSDGTMLTGWKLIEGVWYHFDNAGYMQTGWLNLNGVWYYLEPDGKMVIGWKTIGDSKFYMNSSGAMVTGIQIIDGEQYNFAASGALYDDDGWRQNGENRHYYLNGIMVRGWSFINNDWYYFDSITGNMKTNWLLLGGTWFYLNKDGKMATGWLLVGRDNWYYLNPSYDSNGTLGAMRTGWCYVSDTWYYLNQGRSPEGLLTHTGVTPVMGNNGVSVDKMVRMYMNSGRTYPAYALSKGQAPSIREFCQIVYDEAAAEGVKAEVAFCQAMLETGYLQFGGDVSINQFNFAGLGATGNGVKGEYFSSVRQGIRAQVQHLKAYASDAPLKNTCVDNRFKYVTRNSAPYVEWLGIKENPYGGGKGWAAGINYGFNLVNLYIARLYSM